MVTLQFRQLVVHPGQRIQLQEVNWKEFEAILDELGDKRACRIAYSGDISYTNRLRGMVQQSRRIENLPGEPA